MNDKPSRADRLADKIIDDLRDMVRSKQITRHEAEAALGTAARRVRGNTFAFASDTLLAMLLNNRGERSRAL